MKREERKEKRIGSFASQSIDFIEYFWYNKASEIVVEDDGPGFEASDNNEPHIALNNIRERLDMMCGGALAISVREGGGTTVKVTIPFTQTD